MATSNATSASKTLDPSDISEVQEVPRGQHIDLPGFDVEEHFLYHCTARLEMENMPDKMLVTTDVADSPEEMARAKPTAFSMGIFTPLAAWIHDWARAPYNANYPVVRLFRSVPDQSGGVRAEGRLGRTMGPVHALILVPPGTSGGHIIDLEDIGGIQVAKWTDGRPPMNVEIEAGDFIYRHPDLPDGPWRKRDDPMMA